MNAGGPCRADPPARTLTSTCCTDSVSSLTDTGPHPSHCYTTNTSAVRLTANLCCSDSYVRRQRGTARIRTLLPLSAGRAAVARYRILPGPQQQTCSCEFAAVDSCWDEQTNGRTDTVPLHRPCSPHIVQEVPINSCVYDSSLLLALGMRRCVY